MVTVKVETKSQLSCGNQNKEMHIPLVYLQAKGKPMMLPWWCDAIVVSGKIFIGSTYVHNEFLAENVDVQQIDKCH